MSGQHQIYVPDGLRNTQLRVIRSVTDDDVIMRDIDRDSLNNIFLCELRDRSGCAELSIVKENMLGSFFVYYDFFCL